MICSLKHVGDSEGPCAVVKRVCRRGCWRTELWRRRSAEGASVQVSVIVPVYNAAEWLDECLQAVLDQDFKGSLELSVYDDSSTVRIIRLHYTAD
ncbi:hypothetical protein AOLI_G00234830 [Acnodon oligacanthus]